MALDVAVLDVVVDEAEVVAELHRGRARERRLVLTGDRRVGQEPEERAHALAGRRARPVQAEVVADHLVQAVRRGVAIADEPEDLLLRRLDERRNLDPRSGLSDGSSGHGPDHSNDDVRSDPRPGRGGAVSA